MHAHTTIYRWTNRGSERERFYGYITTKWQSCEQSLGLFPQGFRIPYVVRCQEPHASDSKAREPDQQSEDLSVELGAFSSSINNEGGWGFEQTAVPSHKRTLSPYDT